MSRYSASRDLDLRVQKRWYLILNRTEARVYQSRPGVLFEFLSRAANPAARLTERELNSDRPGRAIASAKGVKIKHALDQRHQHHEQTAQRFCSKIAKMIHIAYQKERFQDLVIVAEPHVLGIFRSALPKSTKKSVILEINREFNQGSDQELYDFLQTHFKKNRVA